MSFGHPGNHAGRTYCSDDAWKRRLLSEHQMEMKQQQRQRQHRTKKRQHQQQHYNRATAPAAKIANTIPTEVEKQEEVCIRDNVRKGDASRATAVAPLRVSSQDRNDRQECIKAKGSFNNAANASTLKSSYDGAALSPLHHPCRTAELHDDEYRNRPQQQYQIQQQNQNKQQQQQKQHQQLNTHTQGRSLLSFSSSARGPAAAKHADHRADDQLHHFPSSSSSSVVATPLSSSSSSIMQLPPLSLGGGRGREEPINSGGGNTSRSVVCSKQYDTSDRQSHVSIALSQLTNAMSPSSSISQRLFRGESARSTALSSVGSAGDVRQLSQRLAKLEVNLGRESKGREALLSELADLKALFSNISTGKAGNETKHAT